MDLGIMDIIIILIIAAAAIMGIFKGFIGQLVSIVSLILGIWCASRYTGILSSHVKGWLSLDMSQQTLHIIIFIAIFIIAVIIAHFIGKGIEGIAKLTMMGWLNRILGFLFGAAKAIIILSIAASALNWINGTFHLIPDDFLADSRAYGFLSGFAKEFFPFLQKYFS